MTRFHDFIQAFTQLMDQADGDEARIFMQGKQLLSELIRQDDWLPAKFSHSSVSAIGVGPLVRFTLVPL